RLGDASREDVKAIILDVSSHSNPDGSTKQKIADIYSTYMDTGSLNAAGMQPLSAEMARINAIETNTDLSAYMSHAGIYSASPLGMYVYIDQKQSDRDYYFKEGQQSQSIRDKYQQHIINLFELANFSDAKDRAKVVYAIEKDLAEGHWTRVENRNRDKTYNKMSFAELTALLPAIDWAAWLTNSMITQPDEIVVSQPSYLETLNNVIQKYDITAWQNYYHWHLLRSSAPYLSAEFEQENFDFYGTVLTGTTEQEDRWKRGVDLVNGLIGELVGKIYVERHFPPEAKERMNSMIENLREAYGDSI